MTRDIGYERDRESFYGAIPSTEAFDADESPEQREIHEDQLTIQAMVQHCKEGRPEITAEHIRRAHQRELLGAVIGSDNFVLGENEQTARFSVLKKRVRALDQPQQPAASANPANQPKRYHRA